MCVWTLDSQDKNIMELIFLGDKYNYIASENFDSIITELHPQGTGIPKRQLELTYYFAF